MKRNSIYIQTLLGILIASIGLLSCKKFIEVPAPETKIDIKTVFLDDATATSSVVGIYARMMNNDITLLNGAMSFFPSLSADEIIRSTATPDYDVFSSNALLSDNTTITGWWVNAYNYIYHANACIEGLNQATEVSAPVKKQLLGEAKFCRALVYFYLANLYGEVPIVTSTDYNSNAVLPRNSLKDVYQLIVADLIDAKSSIATNYQGSDKARPNKMAVSALLARVYLYQQDWANADAEATNVISSGKYSFPSDINNVFLRSSSETIWQLASVNTSLSINTSEGNQFIPSTSATTKPNFIITNALSNAFEANDARKINWLKTKTISNVNYVHPFKYKTKSGVLPYVEFNIMLRLAEQYLIRAEARAQIGNFTGAQADLNIIRKRAGLGNSLANDKPSLLAAIEQERRVEFFCEVGHRWFDLKRTGRADVVLAPQKGTNWQATDILYPIPLAQILANVKLTQNPGY